MAASVLKSLVNYAHYLFFLVSFIGLSGNWPPHASVKNLEVFDYIVIGSGAGGIVSYRLSENKKHTVLLIEAGDVPSVESEEPGLFFLLQESYQDYKYRSQREPATQSQSNGVFKVAAGLNLGGTSNINHFVYLRGHKRNYDSWGDSWSYENVLPYFKKAENLQDADIQNSKYNEIHSQEGPMIITRELHSKADEYLAAFAEVGQKVKIDLNGEDTVGYAQPTISVGNGKRQSIAQAYLRNLSRPNLKIMYRTIATKINFDSKNTARSVDILENGEKKRVKARKEIIVSAGVFATPKLLMLSGIGPQEDLKALNIPVIKDLPVGKNLQDHAAVQLLFEMDYSLELPAVPVPSKLGLPIFIGNCNTNKSKNYPNYQSTNIAITHDTPYVSLVATQIFGFDSTLTDNLQQNTTGRNLFYSLIADINPISKGEVKLNSTDPRDLSNLIIKPNFYSNKTDIDNMVKYITDFIQVQNSTYFKKCNSKLVNLQFDDCKGDFDDENYVRCYILHMTATLFHQTSTCPMGNVVDDNLKVTGTRRLRIVDASVLPNIPWANPLASVVMVAEKASDMIKKDGMKLKPQF